MVFFLIFAAGVYALVAFVLFVLGATELLDRHRSSPRRLLGLGIAVTAWPLTLTVLSLLRLAQQALNRPMEPMAPARKTLARRVSAPLSEPGA